MVCRMEGIEGTYVKEKMLNKVIEREANLLGKHASIRNATNNILILKNEAEKRKVRRQKEKEYTNLPKYSHDYVDR